MPPTVPLKRVVKKTKSKADSSLVSAAAPTLASDGIARPVTRSEFQELVAAVTQLKKQLQRQITVEAQVGTELEVFGAQVASNKSALGKLAEVLIDKTQELQEAVTKHLQQQQVESDRRLTDVQLALERLEFRFKHHVRDCQSVAEQVDMHREALQHIKSQVGQTQLALDKQNEQHKAFVEVIQYSTKTAEDRVKAVASECSNSLEAFQQRMVAFVKGVEESAQQSVSVVVAQTRDLELQGKRYKSLLHQHLDEQVGLRQALVECEAKLSHLDMQQNDSHRIRTEDTARLESLEGKVGKLLLLVERRVERDDVEALLERSERNLKTRIEAVLELVQMCIQGIATSNSRVESRH